MRTTAVATMLAALLCLAGSPGPAAAGAAPAAAAATPADAAEPPVTLDGGAATTRDAIVTVSVAPPTGSASLLRISLDGGSTWATVSYATAFGWSLVDPEAGGTDEDGVKTVTVEAGDGVGPWATLGSAGIRLDRAGPVVSRVDLGDVSGWNGRLTVDVADAGVGLQRTEVSLDGTHWRALDPQVNTAFPPRWIDYREGTIGGSWTVGERTVWVRGVDRLGNVGEAASAPGLASRPEPVQEFTAPAVFEYPLPAVVGQPFIRPVFDAGYRVPAGRYCFWQLLAGDEEARFEAMYNPTLIRVDFSVAPRDGVCAPWTFTLPYTPPLEYSWTLGVGTPGDQGSSDWWTNPIEGSFRAESGTTTSRAITASNLPLYYVVPDRDYVDADGTVTYRLYRAGGAPERQGTWSCQPAIHPPAPGGFSPESQEGGTSFRCHVTSTGAWEADWVTFAGGRRWLVQYDPVGDRRAPTVTSPVVRVGTSAAPITSAPPVDVTWSGRDRGTGITRFVLERSSAGGAWRPVTLSAPRATTARLRLKAGTPYRFRVRARDRAGNWSPWSYGATVRIAQHEETWSAIAWSPGWTRIAGAGSSGGMVRTASAAGRTARFAFTGTGVGWFARRGPGQGFAQVRVDGALVATVNLEAATLGPSRLVWRRTWATPGRHVVAIRLLGTTGRPAVEVDAIGVIR